MWLLRLALIIGVLGVLAPGANAKSPCSVRLKDGTTLPCVDPAAADAGAADKLLMDDYRQSGQGLEASYNCFFYIHTHVLRNAPYPPVEPSENPLVKYQTAVAEGAHETPGTDYLGPDFVQERGYKLVSTPLTISSGSNYQVGDIIFVPGTDNTTPNGEVYVHVGLVYVVSGGKITKIRQKHNPNTGVVDLTPQQFQNEYPPQDDGPYPGKYEVYRHSPLKGKITVKTGYVRHPDGLYATAQQISVTIFLMTPDGAYIGPQPIFPRGAFVAVDGIFHSSGSDNFSFQFQNLYDAQGGAHGFNQTIPLHYECSSQMAC